MVTAANNDELKKYCESICSYERKTGTKGLHPRLPYIVSSRTHQELIVNLQKNDFPILVEGIHCTGILESFEGKKRKILVRLHNDESAYYKKLSESEKRLFQKIFFWKESNLLNKISISLAAELPVCLHIRRGYGHFQRKISFKQY